jgi:hypothetical protein
MSCKQSSSKANDLLRQYATVILAPNAFPSELAYKSQFNPAIDLLKRLIALEDIGDGIPLKGIEDWRYHCFETILLEFGQFFRIGNRINLKSSNIDQRFRYAADQQSANKIYVEGMVLRSDDSLFEHAWIYDMIKGTVVDEIFNAKIYFGIPFTRDFVEAWNKGFGIFSPETSIELLTQGIPSDAIWVP